MAGRRCACRWVIANPNTQLHHSAAIAHTEAKPTVSSTSCTVTCCSGGARRPSRRRSQMVTHTQVAGTSSTRSSRQFVSSSLMPRTTSTSMPATQATGAR